MKVVYINPAYGDDFVRSARWAAKSRGRVQRHPEQALTHIAILEKAGHLCKFIEGAALNIPKTKVLEDVENFKPDMAIIHTTTPSIYSDIEYAKDIKNKLPYCLVVLVGAHASALPEETLKISEGRVGVIARGECDYALRDLANQIPFNEVKGISFLEDGVYKSTQFGEAINVNELPYPSWKHVELEWYHDAGKLFPFITIYSGRGCFGQCTFCREPSVISSRKFRLRDPELVVNEMEYDLKLFPKIKEIMFETDTFTGSSQHTIKICEEIMRRRLEKRIKWSCNVRVDVDTSILPLMKKAGCRMLMIGFEFGTNKQLDSIKKGVTIEQSRSFAKEAHRLGFTLHGCFMIGAPNETTESAQATIDFAKSLPLDTIQISGMVVYPGTPLYDWAKKNNFITAKDWTDWVDKNGEQASLLSYPQMSKETIDFYIDKGLKEFYLRPYQIFRMLLSIRNLGDVYRKVYGFRKFIDYFNKKN